MSKVNIFLNGMPRLFINYNEHVIAMSDLVGETGHKVQGTSHCLLNLHANQKPCYKKYKVHLKISKEK